ncbi:MAG: hypoxanthine phosphoribosyltransferase [Chloroflexia bacterium]|nr:hypoxanthine phosphoribosyltransferase [Chloroflexia bacterium]
MHVFTSVDPCPTCTNRARWRHRNVTVIDETAIREDRLLTEPRARGIARILISEQELDGEIAAIAAELDAEYRDDQPLMIGVLTGAVVFMSNLMTAMTIPVQIDFMAISSYGAATRSSGVVRILKDLNEEIEGRRVIVVEDIVDSGLTLQYLLEMLKARQPKDIRVVALLKKDKPDAIDVQVDRVGFQIPDEFVIGYGLDYAGQYRNLPYVAVLDPSVYR